MKKQIYVVLFRHLVYIKTAKTYENNHYQLRNNTEIYNNILQRINLAGYASQTYTVEFEIECLVSDECGILKT